MVYTHIWTNLKHKKYSGKRARDGPFSNATGKTQQGKNLREEKKSLLVKTSTLLHKKKTISVYYTNT
jgi:hypothetical protein